ncbi:MAG: Anticodon binding domain, partial [Bacteroidetes bacterium]|nr:Anticodon binding domain [Bacteroidota bacterium]
ASARQIPYVALVGENEIREERITVKNLATGEQNSYRIPELIETFKNR